MSTLNPVLIKDNEKCIENKNYLEYKEIVADLLKNDMVKEMKLYNHHYTSTCYSHSLEVSYYSFCIAKKLHLDFKAVARARFAS